MYVFLLALGGAITASGIALVVSGISPTNQAFDIATITPGAVAAIGGLILIGLGLAVRVLERIEKALAVRVPPRPVTRGETVAPPIADGLPQKVTIVAPSAKPQPQPQPQMPIPAAVGAPAPAAAPSPMLEQFRETFSPVVRLHSTPVVPDSEISLSPQPQGRLDEQPGELANGHAPGGNGAAPVPLARQPVDPEQRLVGPPDKRNLSMFETLWPKGLRSGRQTAAAPIPALPQGEPERLVEPRAEPIPAPHPQPALAPVSILKSGVVDGMAYTLYSDGSIEAQLPQGTLRFGSITELRNHIERG